MGFVFEELILANSKCSWCKRPRENGKLIGLGIFSDLRSIKDFMIGIPSKASLLLKLTASLDWEIALNTLGNSAVAERFSYSVVTAGSEEAIIEV